MNKSPEVSVVMSVYNGADKLEGTLKSILSQEGVDLEFIIVNDGSTDETLIILQRYAKNDERLRILDQANIGLTRSLVRGCAEAKGEFIAREDAGDVSLPGRLFKQVTRLITDRNCVAVSCHTKFIGPRGEVLYTSSIDEDELNRSLFTGDPDSLFGPSHHGSVMMRRSVFLKVGGYREQFYFAQDLDLWTRLVEHGRMAVIPEALYEAQLEPGSISGLQTQEQQSLKVLIANTSSARRSGKSEACYLESAAKIQKTSSEALPKRLAQGNYFIGSCLRRASPQFAKNYFRESFKNNPLHWQAWVRYFECTARGLLAGK